MQYGNRNQEIWLESSDSLEKPLVRADTKSFRSKQDDFITNAGLIFIYRQNFCETDE